MGGWHCHLKKSRVLVKKNSEEKWIGQTPSVLLLKKLKIFKNTYKYINNNNIKIHINYIYKKIIWLFMNKI